MSEEDDSIKLVRQWVEKAENDLRTAEHTIKLRKNCPFDTICFHSQQCAEKYIKAMLTLHSVPFPKSHDLPELFSLLPRHLIINVKKAELSALNRYSVETRYPGDFEDLTRPDAKEAIVIARKIRTEVRRYLPKEVNNK